MKSYVTATFKNGDTIKTSINAKPQEAKEYYYGQTFNLGDGQGGDNMQKCVAVFVSPEAHYLTPMTTLTK